LLLVFGFGLDWTELKNLTGFADKNLWDWMKLLLVPLGLAIGGFFLNLAAKRREQALEKQQAQDEALQIYLDQIGQLLLEGDLYNREKQNVARTLARARTLAVLGGLDAARKCRLLQFLYESNLITRDNPVVKLHEADLRGVVLSTSSVDTNDASP
jgi:hypothetical protein